MNYPSDFMEHGYVSSCCGAGIIYSDICMDCKEHCDVEEIKDDEEEDEKESNLMDKYREVGMSPSDFID
jgi:hypothetical protein